MLHFIIPFKSKQVSRDWQRDSLACMRTIQGLLRQSSDSYTITLACHQRPLGFDQIEPYDRVYLIERPDFWVPPDLSKKNGLRADKNRKLLAALASLKKFGSGYVMPVDADDAVHVRMTEYVLNTASTLDLLYADQGYIYDMSTGLLLLKRSMHRRVGTSLVARWEADDLPEHEDDRTKPVILTNSKGNINHTHVVDNAQNTGDYRVDAIPFASVCYVVGTGLQLRGGGYKRGDRWLDTVSNLFRAGTRFWQLRLPSKRWRRAFGFE